jgi:hypothetical protein
MMARKLPRGLHAMRPKVVRDPDTPTRLDKLRALYGENAVLTFAVHGVNAKHFHPIDFSP